MVELIDNNIIGRKREYQIDINSFAKKIFSIEDVIKAFYSRIIFHEASLFNLKKSVAAKSNFTFLFNDEKYKELAPQIWSYRQ